MNDESKTWGCIGIAVVAVVCVLVGGCLGVWPQYKVYEQRLAGEAKLKEAESSRQIQIEDAKGKEQAAKLLADAEVARARGVAEANRIIGDSLKNNPEYLTYLWIMQVNADGNAVIYVPTEAGLPILEAGRGLPRGERHPAAPNPAPPPVPAKK